MERRAVLTLGLALALPFPGSAQPRPRRIAHLSALSPKVGNAWLAAFRSGMREHGHKEGKSYVIDARFANGDFARLPAQAGELARLKPDLFHVYSAEAADAAARAAPGVPIVLANAQDPIASGLVRSLARPGGDITGMSDSHAASATKRIELLKEALPGAKRIALFWRSAHGAHPKQVEELRRAGDSLGIVVVPIEVKTPGEIEAAFPRMKKEAIPAVLMLGDAFLSANMHRAIDLGMKHGIVVMYTTRQFVDAGGMIAYGTDIADLVRRSASHVDRIFKGARPGDLPIEQPVKFDFALNLRTARALGVDLPSALLLRADHVVE